MDDFVFAAARLAAVPVTGALVVRRPRHPVTWVFVAMTVGQVWAAIGDNLIDPGSRFANGNAIWSLSIPLVAPLITVFPDGPRGRLGRALLGWQVTAIAWSVGAELVANDTDWVSPPWWFVVSQVLFVGLLLSGIVAAGSLVRWWRRSAGAERQRAAPAVAVAAVLASSYVVFTPLSLLGEVPAPSWLETALDVEFMLLLTAGMPVAIGLSVLWEQPGRAAGWINRFVSVVVELSVGIALVLVAAHLVIGIGGFETPEPEVVVFPSLLLLVVSAPLRRIVRRPVDALFPRTTWESALLHDLSGQLGLAAAPDLVPSLVVRTVGESLPARGVSLEVEVPGGSTELAASWGVVGPDAAGVELVHAGHLVGRMRIDPAPTSRVLSELDVVLPHVAAALDSARLSRELEATNQRLRSVRDVERRRLQADLHDELSPSLSGIRLAAATVATRLRDGSADRSTNDLVRRIELEAATSVGTVRRILDDLRPDALDDLGLFGAIRRRAADFDRAGEFEVAVRVDGASTLLPPPIETAVYRTAVEAVANAARHAGARHCWVNVTTGPDVLLSVEDDGIGLPPEPRLGIGLTSMRERASSVGGAIELGRSDRGGARVLGRFPVPAASVGV